MTLLQWIDAARGINFLLSFLPAATERTNNPEIGRNVKVNKNEGREHTAAKELKKIVLGCVIPRRVNAT